MTLSTNRPASHTRWGGSRVDRFASLAYFEAGCPIVENVDEMPGVHELLVRLYGPCSVDLVERGAPPGRAVIEYDLEGHGRRPKRVRILRAQPLERLTMALARAVAHWVESMVDECWHEPVVHSAAISIIMPRRPFEALLAEGAGTSDLAMTFHVEPERVLERMRLRVGSHESGERPLSGAG